MEREYEKKLVVGATNLAYVGDEEPVQLSHGCDRAFLLLVVNCLDFSLCQRLSGFGHDFDQIEDQDATPTRAFLWNIMTRYNPILTLV